MVGQMHACTTTAKSAAAIFLVTSSALAGIAVASADPGVTTLPLDSTLRDCDFSKVQNPPQEAEPALATGSVRVHKNGSTAVAEVSLVDSPEPGTQFTVAMIEEPRPSSAPCGPGAPGTVYTSLVTDAAGVGAVTVQDTLRPGTTGVWVKVERPSAHSQDPAEYYTSEFVVPT
jgi:hypothetical protein